MAVGQRDVVKIVVGKDAATGFMVGDGLLLTARHVVSRKPCEIALFYGASDSPPDQPDEWLEELDIVHDDADADWIVLRVAGFPGQRVWSLAEATAEDCERPWATYGFPTPDGLAASGTLESVDSRRTRHDRMGIRKLDALQLWSKQAAAGDGQPQGGYSGAPVVMSDQVVGVLVTASVGEDDKARGGTVFAQPAGPIAAALGLQLGRLPTQPEPSRRAAFDDGRFTEAVFVGRDDLLVQLAAEVLSVPPKVTMLVGMPGVGKSFLADHFAHLHRREFPGGLLRVVLDPREQRSARQLLNDLAARLEVEPRDVAAQLRARHVLLHIENADDQASGSVAREFVRQLPHCAVVVTGRRQEVGRQVGWTELEVGVLGPDEALALLVRESHAPADEHVRSYYRLIEIVGGLPLALSLAASHLRRGWTVDDFLARLQRGLDMRPMDLPDEEPERLKAVLETSIGLTWDALAEELDAERHRALARLGYGPSVGFGTSLGASVTGLERLEFLEAMSRAEIMSLVQTFSGSRTAWTVHPIIAAFLRKRIDGGAVLDAMSDWFLARFPGGAGIDEREQGRRWQELGDEQDAMLEWLRRLPNARQAEVIRSASYYATLCGPYAAWMDLCDGVLASDIDEATRSNTLWLLAQVARRGGENERALQAAEAKRVLDQKRGAEIDAALAAGAVADALEERGEIDKAFQVRQEQVLPVLDRVGDRRRWAAAMGKVADTLERRGDLDEALRIRRDVELPAYLEAGDMRELALARGKIAEIQIRRGEVDGGLRMLEEQVLPMCEQLGDRQGQATVLGRIADIQALQGRPSEALKTLIERELPVYERSGNVLARAATFVRIADILEAQGEVEEALAKIREALLTFEHSGDVLRHANALGRLARAHVNRGELDEALKILEQQLSVYENLGDVREVALTHGHIADILAARGEVDAALKISVERQIPMFKQLGARAELATCKGQLAGLLVRKGQLDDALRLLRDEVLPELAQLGIMREHAVALGRVAEILFERGEYSESLRILREDVAPAFGALGAVREQAGTLRRVVRIMDMRGDTDGALKILREEVVPLYDRVGARVEWAQSMAQIAEYLGKHNPADALKILQEDALPIFEGLRNPYDRVKALERIAEFRARLGEPNESLRILTEEVIPFYEQLGDRVARADGMFTLAGVHIIRKKYKEALRVLREEVLPVRRQCDDRMKGGETLIKIAEVLFAQGEHKEVVRLYREDLIPLLAGLPDELARAAAMFPATMRLSQSGGHKEAIEIVRNWVIPPFERAGYEQIAILARFNLEMFHLQYRGRSAMPDVVSRLVVVRDEAQRLGMPQAEAMTGFLTALVSRR